MNKKKEEYRHICMRNGLYNAKNIVGHFNYTMLNRAIIKCSKLCLSDGVPIKFILAKRFKTYSSSGSSSGNSIKNNKSSFDKKFDVQRAKKAWELSNLDKDTWYKKKYAHVHARAKEESNNYHNRDPYDKKSAHVQKLRHIKDDIRRKKSEHQNKYDKRHVYSGLQTNPLMEYVYGTNCVLAALQNFENKREYFSRILYYGDSVLDNNPRIKKLCENLQIELVATDKHELNLLSHNGVHNNIVLETKPVNSIEISSLGQCDANEATFEISELDPLGTNIVKKNKKYMVNDSKQYPLGVYLDEISDPYNMGAIIRSSYFLGVDFLIISRKNCAPLSPVVNKASSGALEYLPIYTVDKPLNFVTKSQEFGDWTFISSDLIKNKNQNVNKTLKLSELNGLLSKTPTMLIVGNEGTGVRTNLKSRSNYLVEIPFGRQTAICEQQNTQAQQSIDSLNVSVATALLLSNLLNV